MGGDHKCPLCSATFTRPQHVGRHLRAHTGDRPYECKECPLRFARSDLLSRHVNKAHPKPNGVHDNKHEKKGRSKSLSTVIALSRPPTMTSNMASSLPHQPEPTAYQAQRMYPHHPLLQQNHSAAPWAAGALDMAGGGGVANFNMGLGGPVHLGPDVIGSLGNATTAGITFLHLFGGHPITYAAPPESSLAAASGYDLAAGLAAGGPLATTLGYELNTKKRACDQCNHSKVRCDFADPCARCNHRHVQCTYTKPQRSARARNVTYPIPNVPGLHLTTSPNHRTQSLGQPPTTMMFASSPSSYSRPQDNDAVSMARRASEQSSASSDFIVSDILSASTERIRPPVPETNWDNAGALHPRSQSMSNASSSIGQGGLISQSPSSALGLALTPTLTSDTSPSVASDGTDRHGSQGSINTSNWALPPSILSQKSAIKFVSSFVAQQNGDMDKAFQGNPQFAWPNHPGGIDTSMLPVESALSVSSDGATPPESQEEEKSARRRSSTGIRAHALKEMHIDDTVGQSVALDNALDQLPFDMSRERMFPTLTSTSGSCSSILERWPPPTECRA